MHRNHNLISLDYSFEIDTSELESRLESIGALDEDRVRELIEQEIDNRALMSSSEVEEAIGQADVNEDRVDEIVRDLMHSEGEDFVQGVVNGMGFVSEYDLDDKIRDADFAASDDFDTLVERVDALEGVDNEDVTTLKRDVADLARRLDVDANKADSVRTFEDRIEALEGDRDDLRTAGGSYEDRLERLERTLAEQAERNTTAITFFDLLKQAMALLRS